MGFFTLILAIGLGFGALFLLLLLYFLCRSCDEQNRTVDEYRYKQPPSHQTVPRRSHQSLPRSSQPSHPEQHNNHPQPNFPKKLDHRLRRDDIVDVENDDDLQLRTWKPEKKNVENVFYINEVKRPSRSLLTKAAIEKHVDPNCETDMDAVRISEERSRKYTKTWCNVNHVFKVQPSDFKEVYMPKIRMQVIKSKNPCKYWQCSKKRNGGFKVDETGRMFAIFRKSDCHLLIKESRDTRLNTNMKPAKRSRSGIR